jgi:hypothetical protein
MAIFHQCNWLKYITLVTSSLIKVCLLFTLIFPFSFKISVAYLLLGRKMMLRSIQSISNCWSWVELNTRTMSKPAITEQNLHVLTLTGSALTVFWTGEWWQFYCCSRRCYQVSFGFLTHMWAYISWSGIKMSILIKVSWILTWHSSWSMITLHLIFT